MRFSVYLSTVALSIIPMGESTRLDAEIMLYSNGQGGSESFLDTDSNTLIHLESEADSSAGSRLVAESDSAMEVEINADAKLASMVSA